MQSNLRIQMRKAINDYENVDRKEWISKNLFQIAQTVDLIQFTGIMEENFLDIPEEAELDEEDTLQFYNFKL